MSNEYIVYKDELTGVADVIRESGETSDLLEWPEGWKTAIREIKGGMQPRLVVTAPENSTITATNGEKIVSGAIGTEGVMTLKLPEFGTWETTASLDGLEASESVNILQDYFVTLNYSTDVTLHGAPSETISILVDGAEVASVVMDSNGEGSTTIVGLQGKSVIFTGSVSGYSKTIEIGSVESIDVSVYPDRAIWWYGRKFTDVTGGWEASTVNYASGFTPQKPTVTNDTNSTRIGADGGTSIYISGSYITVSGVDFSGANTITFIGTVEDNVTNDASHALTLGVVNTNSSYYYGSNGESLIAGTIFGSSGTKSFSLNGSLSGKYDVLIGYLLNRCSGSLWYTLKAIYLE